MNANKIQKLAEEIQQIDSIEIRRIIDSTDSNPEYWLKVNVLIRLSHFDDCKDSIKYTPDTKEVFEKHIRDLFEPTKRECVRLIDEELKK